MIKIYIIAVFNNFAKEIIAVAVPEKNRSKCEPVISRDTFSGEASPPPHPAKPGEPLMTWAPTSLKAHKQTSVNHDASTLHRVRPDGTCECRRRVTCAMDDAWWKSSRHRMSQETVTGRFPSLLPGRRRLAAAGWSKGA
ncbi:hypothetical protein EVAR_67716_1 [Eumeta japonica]|uniref:Uncharacterized protein n=1 Tax=Eumeta variegata TaxID=151549 RepID=A0A4C1ZET5_EUMVA|nr:hypothetical protein EVAR_67716_1 [Eumeta japonica]